MDSVVALSELSKQFGDQTAVENVSLSVLPGEIVGLLGPDGAGKTTLLRMVAGLLSISHGSIHILGQDIQKGFRQLRQNIGYMPQQYSLYLDLSVQENLRFFAGMYGVEHRVMLERENRLLHMARLNEFRGRAVGALSGGMYKKLALSCALIHSPKLLLLDEPTNGVDPISRRELWLFLRELLEEGVGVLVSTPYMDEAERCDRVAMLVTGSCVALEKPAILKSKFRFQVTEILLDPPYLDPSILVSLPGIQQAYAVGRKLHVVSNPDLDILKTINPILAHVNVRVVQSQPVAPSFEDIFLSMSEKAKS